MTNEQQLHQQAWKEFGYELECEPFTHEGTPLFKFRNRQTGVRLACAQIAGPLVSGFLTVATKANDDDGCPHVLEHMVFLGSEQYPYKGVLDKLANRCLANGTNAWTDTDHTAYSLTTAGSEGFLNLLPIYLDHVLYPTITDSGFHTEVHHINDNGEDQGVVYCEMQGRENTATSRANLRIMQLMFPVESGYASETGGKVANLRSLKVEKVRSYHAQFYRPENLCLIVTGEISPLEIMRSLRDSGFEEKMQRKMAVRHAESPSVFEKPWAHLQLPRFAQSVQQEIVEFPSDEEESGGASAYLVWRTCPWSDFFTRIALAVLWKYLTESAVSPLQAAFVETEDALCGHVSAYSNEQVELVQFCCFSNVPLPKLPLLRDKFFELMQQISNAGEAGIDMDRMHVVVNRHRRHYLSSIETSPHHFFGGKFIGDFLYGTEASHFHENTDELSRVAELETKSASFWLDLLRRFILDNPYVCVLARPSAELGVQLAKEEEARLAKQREDLGQTRLEELGKQLQEATEANARPIPPELLQKLSIPDTSKIPLINVVTYRNDGTCEGEDSSQVAQVSAHLANGSEGSDLPFRIQVDHIPSNFVSVRCYMDSSDLPDRLRPYLELYLECVFQLPIRRDGVLIPFEQVVKELNAEAVSTSNGIGIIRGGSNFECGVFSHAVNLSLKFEADKYDSAVRWMRELLYQTEFTADRLKISAQKLINDVARARREPTMITRACIHMTNFDHLRCNHNACNFMRQYQFLMKLVETLSKEGNEAQRVLEDMNAMRAHLASAGHLLIHVVGNVFRQPLGSVLRMWKQEFLAKMPAQIATRDTTSTTLFTPKFTREVAIEASQAGGIEQIVGIASTDSAYMSQTIPLLLDRFDADDIAPLIVLNEYLCSLEGPLWINIRGKGLAYGFQIRADVEGGLVYFGLARSGNIAKAYQETAKILSSFCDGTEQFDETELEAAKAASVFEVISSESTIGAAAHNKLVFFFKKVALSRNKDLLRQLGLVSSDMLRRVLATYFRHMFDVGRPNFAITTNPAKVAETVASFAEMGHKIEIIDDMTAFLTRE